MPSTFQLRKLTSADEQLFKDAIAAWDHDKGFLFASGYEPSKPFQTYLQHLSDRESGLNLPAGYVPDTAYFLFETTQYEQKIVGRISIRHQLTPHLLNIGGHIGYGILPFARKRGLATYMLKEFLPIAKSMGINPVLLTCDENNVASRKVIEAAGGQLENKFDPGPDQVKKLRYWINL